MSPPVHKNHHYDIEISDIGIHGEGIGHVDGFAVFVPGAIPGDLIACRIVKILAKFGYGRLMEIRRPSPDRVTPRCPVFGKCGGCQIQHIDYPAQLRLKTHAITSVINRIAGVYPVIHPMMGSLRPWEYRNKVQFACSVGESPPKIGLYSLRSNQLVPTDFCAIQDPRINRLILDFLDFFKKYPTSGVRHLVMRAGAGLMVIVVSTVRDLALVRALDNQFGSDSRIESLYLNVNPDSDNVVLGSIYELISGNSHIHMTICGCQFRLSPGAFFQVNADQASVLAQTVIQYAELTGSETVWDLYGGVGVLGIVLGGHCQSVVSIESVASATADVAVNASLNSLNHITAVNADVVEWITTTDFPDPDVVVLDPPRKGCEPVLLEAIKIRNPQRIIMVSCSPATFARDAKILSDKYDLVEVQPIDMFAQTIHSELVAKFCLIG